MKSYCKFFWVSNKNIQDTLIIHVFAVQNTWLNPFLNLSDFIIIIRRCQKSKKELKEVKKWLLQSKNSQSY
jgi:hypothetical protein